MGARFSPAQFVRWVPAQFDFIGSCRGVSTGAGDVTTTDFMRGGAGRCSHWPFAQLLAKNVTGFEPAVRTLETTKHSRTRIISTLL